MANPADLARPLLDTLRAEEEALLRLDALVGQQLDAVRGRHHAALETLTIDTGNAAAELHRLKTVRERQSRLLGRVLKLGTDALPDLDALATALDGLDADTARSLRSARSRIHTLAARSRQNADTLNFALHYAVSLGREVMGVLQGLGGPAPLRTYNGAGQRTTAQASHSYLNRVG